MVWRAVENVGVVIDVKTETVWKWHFSSAKEHISKVWRQAEFF
jgi:hypothetical protein